MKFRLAAVLILPLCLAFSPAQAQSKNVLAALPAGADGVLALDTARKTLLARNWTIVANGRSSLEAQRASMRLQVFLDENTLYYADESRRPQADRQRNREQLAAFAPVPEDELDGLRRDLDAAFGTQPPLAAARSRILLEGLPSHLEPARVMDLARGALVRRRWSVIAENGGELTASMRGSEAEYVLKLLVADGALRFIDQTRRAPGAESQGKRSAEKAEVPERWIGYLRSDITQAIAALPPASASAAVSAPARSAAPAATGNPAERLRTLKSLLDSGLITQAEYEAKRAEILKGL